MDRNPLAALKDFLAAGAADAACDLYWSIADDDPAYPALTASICGALFRARQWPQAAACLKRATESHPNSIGPWMWLCLCLIELDRYEEALQCQHHVVTLRATGGDAAANFEKLIDPIYQHAHMAFHLGDSAKALRIYSCFAVADPLMRRRFGTERRTVRPPTAAEDLSDRGIGRFLDGVFDRWERGETPRPAGLAAAEEGFRDFGRLRLLICVRERTFARPDSRKHELGEHLRETAEDVGFNVMLYDGTPHLFPHAYSAEEKQEEINRFEQTLREFRPHLVVMDWPISPFIDFEDSIFGTPDPILNADYYLTRLPQLKSELGFSLVALFIDVWVGQWLSAVRAAAGVADVGAHYYPQLSRSRLNPLGDKDLCLPGIIFSDRILRSGPEEERDIDMAFVGSVFTYIRSFWFSLIRRRGLPVQLLTNAYQGGERQVAPTTEAFAALMRRMKISVNIGSRDRAVAIVVGRVLESIKSGCLLFEETNPQTAHFFAPFVHYVPFNDIVELEAYARFFLTHDDWRRRIADTGLEWSRTRLSKENLWSRIVTRAGIGEGRL